MKILRVNGEGTKIYCSFTGMKRKIRAEYLISNTFRNCFYGSLKETPLICKVLEQSSQLNFLRGVWRVLGLDRAPLISGPVANIASLFPIANKKSKCSAH